MVKYDLLRMAKKLNDMEDYRMWKHKFRIEDLIKPEMGELVVIYQAGLGAIKKSRGTLLSDKNMRANIRFSFNNTSAKKGVALGAIYAFLKTAENPISRFVKRPNRIKSIIIEVDGKYLARTNLLENIENTAVKNMEEQYTKMYAKVVAGIVAKAITAITAIAAGLMSQIKPDLRCWHTLPANLQMNRIFLKPDVYDFTIKLIGKYGSVLARRMHKMQIQKGKKAILNYRTLF